MAKKGIEVPGIVEPAATKSEQKPEQKPEKTSQQQKQTVSVETIKNVVATSCTKCHTPTVTGTTLKDLRIYVNGKTDEAKDLNGVVNAFSTQAKMRDIKSTPLEAQFREWAKQQQAAN